MSATVELNAPPGNVERESCRRQRRIQTKPTKMDPQLEAPWPPHKTTTPTPALGPATSRAQSLAPTPLPNCETNSTD